jgi:zinc protease
MLNRTIPPSIKDAVDFDLHLKPYQHFSLDNGVPVYTINAGAQEVLKIELVFYAGNWFDIKKQVAAITSAMLKNGTSTKTAFQINEHFEYYGAHCNTACNNETAVVSLSTLNKHLPQLLPVVKEMITDAVFPYEELNIYKQNAKQRLAVNLQKPNFVANRLMDGYVYGSNHPYGMYSTPEDIDGVTAPLLKEFYKKYYQQGQCIIFASGQLPNNLQQQLNEVFGKLSLSKPAFHFIPPIAAQPAQPGKYRHQVDPAGVQGSISIARPFPNRHHPDYMKVMMLNNVLGGFFGSRLMNNIREDKGYTYGIYSYLQNHIQQTAWLICTDAGKDVCEATIEEVYKEMLLLQNELIPKDELQTARNYMMGAILGDLDGPFQIINRWKNIITNNLDEQFFYKSIQTIKNISAEELRELAKKYLNPEDFYELVVI